MGGNSGSAFESSDRIVTGVLNEYGIKAEEISLVQSGTVKTVWKVKAAGRLLCLKRLKQTMDKALFSVNAQIYIRKSGGNVPEVLLNKAGKPIIQFNDQLFVLYEWISGNDLDFGSPLDLRRAVRGLASFHNCSRGYSPAPDCRVSSKLGKWTDQYSSMLKRISEWKETAKNNIAQPTYSAYVKYADSMIRTGSLALDLLKKSDYGSLTAEGSKAIVLCHQDYGRGNALATDRGVCVLDLDGVTFDLPARDLRKIAGKGAERSNRWDASSIKDILDWYTEVNPLTESEKNILYIDLLFPHWFFGLVKNLFQGGKPLKPGEIEKIARLEESKVPIIRTLISPI